MTLADRRSAALVEHIDLLRSAVRITRRERPFSLDAFVVLPDHLHAMLTLPDGDADFSGRWRRIKSLFSRGLAGRDPRLRRNAAGEYGVWQRRFWEHTIRDDADFGEHFDYIHFNPVKHGLVTRVRDWPHSSFRRHVRLGWLPIDWGGDMGKAGKP